MTIREAVKFIIKPMHITQIELGERLGYEKQAAFSNKLTRGMPVDQMIDLCDQLGYELVMQPKRRNGKRSADQILLERSGDSRLDKE